MTQIDKDLIAAGVMLADEYDPLEESRTLESMIVGNGDQTDWGDKE